MTSRFCMNRRNFCPSDRKTTLLTLWSPGLLVHGFGCDHTFLLPQLRFLGDRRRTFAVDLRGHGASDAPKQDYTMAGFADDLAWISAQLNLERPIWTEVRRVRKSIGILYKNTVQSRNS